MLEPEILAPLRHRFIVAMRSWFHASRFIEVETPMGVRSPGMEPHLRAFELRTVDAPAIYHHLYLHTSPEYHMKRALAKLGRPIFQICRCFRDEMSSRLHQPEFTMLEWYRPKAQYTQLMDDCEGLLAHLQQSVLEGDLLTLPSGVVDLRPPFERLSVRDAFLRFAQVDPWAALEDTAAFRSMVSATGLDIPEHWTWEDIFHFVLLERVESRLGSEGPVVLFGYPPSLAALSVVSGDIAERFELYIHGHELANAFGELVDPIEQRRRFELEQQERAASGNPVYPIDEALLEALAVLPPSAGIALGVDRLWLLFAEHTLGRKLSLADSLFLGL